jgi:hypothetical protein
MHLLGRAELILPRWEPDQGWRVLDPDGHVVSAGGKTVIHVTALDLAALIGVPLLGTGQERETQGSD